MDNRILCLYASMGSLSEPFFSHLMFNWSNSHQEVAISGFNNVLLLTLLLACIWNGNWWMCPAIDQVHFLNHTKHFGCWVIYFSLHGSEKMPKAFNTILTNLAFPTQNWSAGLSGHITVDFKEVCLSTSFISEVLVSVRIPTQGYTCTWSHDDFKTRRHLSHGQTEWSQWVRF